MADERLELELAGRHRLEHRLPIVVIAVDAVIGIPGAKNLDFPAHQLGNQTGLTAIN